ncbi:MAG: adenosylcobinamide kinase / adenosylcobinamide-phosphate guanylyltransferase [Pseudonocardiales bacterium]|jgi:adenosylcobinamide kinase/adenosylcobinamide-phosphate guanylyltransferase|nr:adenosylcobinamide kinase / adenosylcobinamide-phosphate guanylyltransferase [Pseudonocardiales bacterium]
MTARRTLVLGGVRSGKSRWAEQQLAGYDRVDYLATAAERDDADWARRIAEHQQRRPAHWRTVPTLELSAALGAPTAPLLVEDLGNWLARTIDRTGGWDGELSAMRAEAEELVTAWRNCPGRVVLVSNEVGSGVHPESRSGRIFADELGRLNAALAAEADEVVLVVAGLPLWLRGAASNQSEERV